MSAARATLWLDFPEDEFPELDADSAQRVTSVCTLCGGTGWRPVLAKGDRAVTPCGCRAQRQASRLRPKQVTAVRDYKSAAAGER